MKKASEILEKLLSQLKISQCTKTIFSEWEKIVGKDLALHVKILDLNKGILSLEGDHPGWIQVINIKKNEILLKMHREFPEEKINGIKISLKK